MTTAPIFKITDLHIRGLRGLQKLDLPQDGMGWESGFPPVSVIGGANGSGKTTLLRCIARVAELLLVEPSDPPAEVHADECRLAFTLTDGVSKPYDFDFLLGKRSFVEQGLSSNRYGYLSGDGFFYLGAVSGLLAKLSGKPYSSSSFPRLIFFPSDGRDLIVPASSHTTPLENKDEAPFVVKCSGDRKWNGSLLELLFAARWADLNAKDLGKPEEAKNFERYTRAFTDLTLGEKRLTWTTKGDLVVELRGGAQHSLRELSSGERQAFLLLAELRRFWRPGSLVLIDELELHLHDAWQGKLYDVIKAMQAELGGQVIITTQSHSLFEMADLGTRALLGRGGLR